MQDVALRDRRRLSEDGVLIVVTTVALSDGVEIAPPELIARVQAAILTSPAALEQRIASSASAAAGPATTSIAKQNNSLRSIRKPPPHSVVGASTS